jgi:RNA polymerase sigma factor (sigma-70 family)
MRGEGATWKGKADVRSGKNRRNLLSFPRFAGYSQRVADSGKNSDSDRMQELLRRYEKPLLQFAGRILGDSDRARDVVQETFVKFESNGAKDLPEPATWLFTVCRNGALNVCRKERRLVFVDEAALESEPTETPMPFDRLERDEASGFLMRIVATLPLRQQEVLQLKFQSDLSYQEIAEITKTNSNNVGVLIHTALKTLRKKYAAISRDFLPFEPKES